MRALLEVMQFEIRYQLRSPFFLGALLMFALIHFLAITGTGIHIDISNQVAINSAYAILQIELALFIFGMLPIVAFVTTAITRDFEHATASLVFVTPISPKTFCAGKISRGAEPCAFDRPRRTAGRDDRHLHAVAGSGAHRPLLAAALGVHLSLSSSCPAHSSYAPSSSASRRSPAPSR